MYYIGVDLGSTNIAWYSKRRRYNHQKKSVQQGEQESQKK